MTFETTAAVTTHTTSRLDRKKKKKQQQQPDRISFSLIAISIHVYNIYNVDKLNIQIFTSRPTTSTILSTSSSKGFSSFFHIYIFICSLAARFLFILIPSYTHTQNNYYICIHRSLIQLIIFYSLISSHLSLQRSFFFFPRRLIISFHLNSKAITIIILYT